MLMNVNIDVVLIDGCRGFLVELIQIINKMSLPQYMNLALDYLCGKSEEMPKTLIGICYPHGTKNIAVKYKNYINEKELVRGTFDFIRSDRITKVLFHESLSILYHIQTYGALPLKHFGIQLQPLRYLTNYNKQNIKLFDTKMDPYKNKKKKNTNVNNNNNNININDDSNEESDCYDSDEESTYDENWNENELNKICISKCYKAFYSPLKNDKQYKDNHIYYIIIDNICIIPHIRRSFKGVINNSMFIFNFDLKQSKTIFDYLFLSKCQFAGSFYSEWFKPYRMYLQNKSIHNNEQEQRHSMIRVNFFFFFFVFFVYFHLFAF